MTVCMEEGEPQMVSNFKGILSSLCKQKCWPKKKKEFSFIPSSRELLKRSFKILLNLIYWNFYFEAPDVYKTMMPTNSHLPLNL